MKYIKKQTEIQAVQFYGSGELGSKIFSNTPYWLMNAFDGGILAHRPKDKISIFTLEGEMQCSAGDYIIKGVQGELYPCKQDIFEATYDKIGGYNNGK